MYLFEPLFRRWRIKKVLAYIPSDKEMVDIGCDDPPKLLQEVCDKMKWCFGIDAQVKDYRSGNIEIRKQKVVKKIKLPSESVDVVTMLAVLEHMKFPGEVARECYRILKSGGRLLITVPTNKSKPLLELLAVFKLVRPEMIDQHEDYFSKETLGELLRKVGFKIRKIDYFGLGLNLFAWVEK